MDFLAKALVDAGGTLDLLVAITGTGDVSVFLGDGQGGFAAQTAPPIGVRPNGIVTGDLNADGKLDLAVIHLGDFGGVNGGLKIALGNGDGTFGAAQTVRANVEPDSIAITDFNLDGKLDLAVSLQARQFDSDPRLVMRGIAPVISSFRSLNLLTGFSRSRRRYRGRSSPVEYSW